MIPWLSVQRDVLGVNLLAVGNYTATAERQARGSAGHGRAGAAAAGGSAAGRRAWHPGETNAFSRHDYKSAVVEWFGKPPGDAERAGKITGDASVSTLASKDSLRRIKALCGDAVR